MLRKIIGLTLLFCLVLSTVVGQNAIVGTGFSSGWGGGSCPTGNGDFSYLSPSAGSSYILITSAGGTGDRYWRFGVDWGGTTAQLTNNPGSDVVVAPNTTYNLNTNCTTNGALQYNVANTAYNYVFKTLNAGSNPTGTWVFFEVQGAIQSVSSVSQSPVSNAVTPGSNVTVTANLSGALSSGQNVYLRYTTNNYTTSTVVAMTGSGTTYTATIPAGTNTAGANVSYYVFTSGSNVATDGSNADLYTINLNNNGGTNYSYTVLSPATIYQHNFGTTTISAHPYTVAPGVFATNLSNSSWANSNNAWTSYAGSSGEAIALSNSSGTPTITLTFDVASGFAVDITSFNFWRQRSATGAQNWSMTINGIAVGSGTVPTSGSAIGTTNVSNVVSGLTGTVTVVLSLSGASGTGTFRLDDFTLNGIVYPLPGPTALVQSPVGTTIANGGSRASFGNIVVGTTADFPVRIRNVGGTNTLTVNSISFGGAHAADLTLVTPPTFPFNVAPGGFQDLTVRVAPGTVGARTATMTVASNDASGNSSYVINLSATGIASTASDIIDNTNYSGGSPEFNINPSYINFTDGTATTAGKIIAMKFRIRDGGAGLNDADNLSTTLTAISFNVKNTASADRGNFIKQAILTTSDGTVIATASSITASQIIFTGLTNAAFTVADNTQTANLHLRISFNELTVVDNEKLVFTVASATAAATGSGFAAPNAGGAQTDNATNNDRNRIEVVATRFAFVQQPTNTGFGQTMTPSPTVEAQDANSRRDLDFTSAIILTSSGTMTGSPISVNAVAGLATFTSVIHTVQQTGRQLTASGSLTAGLSSLFDINASSGTTDFFRTATGFTTGNWNATSSWESSPDNVTWVPATLVPNSSASGITVRSGTLTITSDASAKLLTVQSGAVLVHNNGAVFTIADDGTAATDFLVQGRYELNGRQPVLNPGATAIIATGAEVRAVSNNAPGESDDFARNTAVIWQNNSVFSWNTISAFETSGATYFSGTPPSVIPVFRIQANTFVGASGNTTINGVLEIAGPTTNVTWNNTGDKTFRNGITGTGTLTQGDNCGQFRINGTTSQLGSGNGTLTLILRDDVSSGLALQSGTCSLLGNVTSNNGPLYVDAGATLNAGTNSISGSSSFTLNSGATLVSAHAAGVNGSIAITGTPNFNNGSNYVFNGTVNQATGTRMATVVDSLTIANTGTAPNNVVTLTNNNTSTNALILSSGLFAAGVGQTLRINAGGTVAGTGGHVSTNINGEGGTIEFLGSGSVTGTPNLWIVAIGNSGTGVSFTNNAPIYHQCIIGSGGFVTNAPTYQNGSTLIYRTGGTYARNVEWGNTAGLPGYPHHVTVDGNTIVDLNTNNISPDTLAIGGNLQLGSSNGYGRMYLNNNMNKPLEVRGHLTIGVANPVPTNNELALSNAIGGDLILHGNFTRYNGSFYNDNGRAIFFRGAGNTIINVPGIPAPSPTSTDPTLQDFSYAIVDKTVNTAKVTLNVPVGVTEKLTLTKGIVDATAQGLFIKQPAPDAPNIGIQGGSADSYIDGKLYRYTSGSTTGNYWFPIGNSAGGYRPLRFTNTNTGGDRFVAEYFKGATVTPSAGQDIFQAELTGIQANEYWQFDRLGSQNTTGRVALMYRLAGATWRNANGDPLTPVGGEYNVAIVKRTDDTGPGSWSYTKPPYTFNTATPDFEARLYSDDGLIVTGDLSSFSPFTFGFSYSPVLGSLPVKLLSFEGALQGADARLQWRIDSDKDLRHFELQYSTDGSQFSTLATVVPAGRQYQYLHRGLAAGKHYYRLRVMEKDGQQFYSKTVLLSRSAGATYVVGLQQNPVGTSLALNLWSASAQAAEYSLTDMGGRQLLRRRSQLLPGANQLRMPVAQLPAGVYHLTVLTADGVQQTLRVLKQ